MKSFEVIVVGTGPAGSMAARELAKAGIHTALIDREKLPRYKTCGGGVTWRARKIFSVDIQPVVEREYYHADLIFVNDDMRFTVKRDQPIITMVMRDALDHHLVKAAQAAGAELMDAAEVIAVEQNGMVVLKTNRGQLQSHCLIAADGALSPVAKMCGWKETRFLIPALEYEVVVSDDDFARLAQTVRFDIDAIPCGYAWSFPKQKHLSLGVASAKRGKINLHDYYRSYLRQLGVTTVIHEEKHGFQIPMTPRRDVFVKNAVVLAGDAAGFADPVTAEGISNSALSGKIAASAIIESRFDTRRLGVIYNEKLREDLLPQLKLGRFLSGIFYGKTWIRRPLFHKYGQRLCEALTDVFMGTRGYPHDAVKRVRKYLKEFVGLNPQI